MIYSKGSVIECGQRAQDVLSGVVVVPYRRGQGEDALHDAGDDTPLLQYDFHAVCAWGRAVTPKEQEKRERVRLEAAGRFARGEKTEAVARDLRVTPR